MVEMGMCIGRCRNIKKCFFVKKYFMCSHLMCYNIVIRFKHCIRCGNDKLREPACNNNNNEEIEMRHNILDSTCCYCRKAI